MIQFHGSNIDFDRIDFTKSTDIGFHVGTLQHAIDKIFDVDRSRFYNQFIYTVEINPTEYNCIHLEKDIFEEGMGLYPFKSIIKEYLDKDLLNDFDFIDKFNECESLSDLRELLIDVDYQYISYNNQFEGPGMSYCILTDHKLNKWRCKELLSHIHELL